MQKIKVKYTVVFEKTHASKKRIIINVGGARSSKSYSVAQLFVLRFLSCQKRTQIVTRKTFPALKATAMHDVLTIMQEWGVYSRFQHNKTDAVLTNPKNGNIMRFISIEDPTRIRSMQANDMWLEEANEFAYIDYLTLKTRLSSPTTDGLRNQIFFTLNPSDSYGWINQKLVNSAQDEADSDKNDVEIIYSSYKDNPFLDEDYKKSLEALKEEDDTYYKIFTLGVWAQAGSIIYSNYDIVPSSRFPSGFDEEIIGLDFGFNNPASALFIGVKDNEAWVREIVYQSHLTNPDFIELVKQGLEPKYFKSPCRADESEPDRIEEFRRAGFRIEGAPKGKNSLRDGIDFCKRIKLYISDDSINVIKEIRGYKWKEKEGQILDEPVKFLDHAMDAMRYALTSLKSFVKPQSALVRKGPASIGARHRPGFGGRERYGTSRY